MTIWELSEKADYIADRHRQHQEQWHTYCNSLVQGITLSKARLHHAMSCAPDKELCFVLFGHFQVYVALAEGFNSHTIEYYVETKNGDDRRLIAQATLGSDGTIDGRISNRDREQVLEHYLATIASVYDRLYEAIEQDQPVDLSHLTLAVNRQVSTSVEADTCATCFRQK